jgi:hypothetical protein
MSKYEIETKGKTVVTVHNEASTWLSFSTEENPVKVTIFDKEYFLNWASIETVWGEGDYIPEAIVQVSFVTILKSGKAGDKYDKREFSISDIGKWIKGEEDVFKQIFKQHAQTVQDIIKEKAVV